jgi:hypothetical protein
MTGSELSALTHERLIDQIEHTLTGDHYLRDPRVPPVRIGVYPKRRADQTALGLSPQPAATPEPAGGAAAVTYADFFRRDDQIAI